MKWVTVLLLILNAKAGSCQSYFYNTQHFGLQSTLLGGAVTAGSSDLSMVYYNPAALRYSKDRGFDVAIFMPSYNVSNYGDVFNSGEELRSSELSLNPSLITYKTSIKNFNIVFGILQKDVWDTEVSYNQIKNSELFDKNESFTYSYKGDEKWFGFGSHFSLSETVSVGFSQFWRVQSTDYNYHVSSEVVTNRGIQANFFNQILDLDYRSLFAMVTKVGLAVDRPEDRIGVVITTPYYQPARLSGSFERTTSIFDADSYTLDNIVDFDLQPNLKSGWQLDLGYARMFSDSSEIWINGSIHTGVARHDVLTIERTQGDPLAFSRGLGAVTNISVGHSRFITPKIQFMGSLRTNISAFRESPTNDESEQLVILEQDRINLALGFKVQHKSSAFVLGLDWGFSLQNKVGQFERFPNIERFDTNPASYHHRSITLLLTYEFFINRVGDYIGS